MYIILINSRNFVCKSKFICHMLPYPETACVCTVSVLYYNSCGSGSDWPSSHCAPFHSQQPPLSTHHPPPLALTDRSLSLHRSTCRNQTLFVCTPFHLQESNIVCVHAIALAGIKHCLCAHHSTGRNQTVSVCTLFHLQESNIACVHTIPLEGIKHFLCARHSTGRNQT